MTTRKRQRETNNKIAAGFGWVQAGKCCVCLCTIEQTVRICANGCSESLMCLTCLQSWKGQSMYAMVPSRTSPVEQRLGMVVTGRKCPGCRGALQIELYPAEFYRMLEESLSKTKFSCTTCDFTSNSLRALMIHGQNEHDSLSTFACPRCSKLVTEDAESLRVHAEEECLNLQCLHPKCGQDKLNSRDMVKHIHQHRFVNTIASCAAFEMTHELVDIKSMLDMETAHHPTVLPKLWKLSKAISQLAQGWDNDDNWEEDNFKFKRQKNTSHVTKSIKYLQKYGENGGSSIPTCCVSMIPECMLSTLN